MSADLLRRAAEKLREHANAATPGPWKTGGGYFRPWELRIEPVVLAEFSHDHDGASTAEYAALMHPPVALALADWLDFCAGVRGPASEFITPPGLPDYALIMARAILREES